MRKKDKIAEAFHALKIDTIIRKVRCRLIKDVPILAYHRVMDLSDKPEYPFDIDLISASPDEFEWQMRFIKQHFTPIRLSQLCGHIDGKSRLPPSPIVVTFDDGFDDNYYAAFPVLKDLAIPATIFVTTSFVENSTTIWYERLAYFIQMHEGEVSIPELGLVFPCLSGVNNRRKYYAALVERLKLATNDVRQEILESLYRRYEESYSAGSPVTLSMSKAVTWEQLKEMSDSIFEVGSHSVTHPVLTMLSDDELVYELSESKSILEEKMKCKVDTIAYPVGMGFAFDQRVIHTAKNAGYRLAVSYLEGVNYKHRPDPYALKRMHVDRGTLRSTFSCKLALPSVFSD